MSTLREAITEDLERCERNALRFEESGERELEHYYNGASDALRRALEHREVPGE